MEFIDRIKYVRGRLTQREFAQRLEVSLGAVQHWEIDGQVPRGEVLLRMRKQFNVDVNWLLTGEGEPYIAPDTPTPYEPKAEGGVVSSNVVVYQHVEIVKQFKDIELAKAANSDLLAIERLNPAAFREVAAYIKGIANGLKLAGEVSENGDRRLDDRRTPEGGPYEPKNDRRTVKDRRKNVSK